MPDYGGDAHKPPYTLRRASDVWNEHQSKKKKRNDESHNKAMKKIIAEIEENKGKGEITSMYVTERVKAELEAAGYKVTYQRACGMGDMDSHRIQWKTNDEV